MGADDREVGGVVELDLAGDRQADDVDEAAAVEADVAADADGGAGGGADDDRLAGGAVAGDGEAGVAAAGQLEDLPGLRGAQRAGWLLRPAYRALSAVWAQTEADAARFRSIGAPQVGVLGNLKFDAQPDAAQQAQASRWRAVLAVRCSTPRARGCTPTSA